jgi:hypothetical protein
MAIVPAPHRAADLAISAFSGLDQSVAAYTADKALDAPLNPRLAALLDRLTSGADPEQLKQEMSIDPELRELLHPSLKQTVSPQAMVPDIQSKGFQGIVPPGTVNPAGGPGPYQPVQAPPPQGQPSRPPTYQSGAVYQSNVPPPNQISAANQTPDSGKPAYGQVSAQALPDAPQPQSLGAMQSQPPPGPRQPLRPAVREPMQSLGSMPMPAMDSAVAPKPAPQAAPTAKPAAGGWTKRDWQSVQGALPSMIAGNSREEASRMNNETKVRVENTKNLRMALVAKAKEAGVDADRIQKFLLDTEHMDDRMQIAVWEGLVALSVAQTRSNSNVGAAQIRANAPKAGPNAALEDLKKLRDEEKALKAQTDWEKQPQSAQRVGEIEAQIREYQDVLGLSRPGGRAGPPQPSGGKPAAPTAQPPAPTGPPANVPQGPEIRVIMLDGPNKGKTGFIRAGAYNPKMHKKL